MNPESCLMYVDSLKLSCIFSLLSLYSIPAAYIMHVLNTEEIYRIRKPQPYKQTLMPFPVLIL